MKDVIEVFAPLLNPNEPEAQIVALHVEEGQKVSEGDSICTLETTKSVAEILAEKEAYVIGLEIKVGDLIQAGARLCWLADQRDWQPPKSAPLVDSKEAPIPPGLRITKPALELAREYNLNLNELPVGPILTEATVSRAASSEMMSQSEPSQDKYDPRAIVIYGGGGHGKSIIDLLRAVGTYDIFGIVDDRLSEGSKIMDLTVLGRGDSLAEIRDQGVGLAVNAVGGVGDIASRVGVFKQLAQRGFRCPSLVHPSAIVEPSAQLSEGVQVFPHAYVGSETDVQFGVIVNTSAVVSHDCRLGAYTNIAPSAMLAGGVSVGEKVLVGMGVSVNLNVEIGANCRIGNGAVIKESVPEGRVVRAGALWPS